MDSNETGRSIKLFVKNVNNELVGQTIKKFLETVSDEFVGQTIKAVLENVKDPSIFREVLDKMVEDLLNTKPKEESTDESKDVMIKILHVHKFI